MPEIHRESTFESVFTASDAERATPRATPRQTKGGESVYTYASEITEEENRGYTTEYTDKGYTTEYTYPDPPGKTLSSRSVSQASQSTHGMRRARSVDDSRNASMISTSSEVDYRGYNSFAEKKDKLNKLKKHASSDDKHGKNNSKNAGNGKHTGGHGRFHKDKSNKNNLAYSPKKTNLNKIEEGEEPAPGCIHCRREIKEGEAFIIDKDGYNYHKDCFKCWKCGDHIHDGQYKPTKNGAMCLSCGLPQCAHCLNLIVGDCIVATHVDGTPYAFHTQCMNCVRCGNHISKDYKATEDGFICGECDLPQCMTCYKKIPGGDQYYLDRDTKEPQCNNCFRSKTLAKQEVDKYFATSPSQLNQVNRPQTTEIFVTTPSTNYPSSPMNYTTTPTNYGNNYTTTSPVNYTTSPASFNNNYTTIPVNGNSDVGTPRSTTKIFLRPNGGQPEVVTTPRVLYN